MLLFIEHQNIYNFVLTVVDYWLVKYCLINRIILLVLSLLVLLWLLSRAVSVVATTSTLRTVPLCAYACPTLIDNLGSPWRSYRCSWPAVLTTKSIRSILLFSFSRSYSLARCPCGVAFLSSCPILSRARFYRGVLM